MKGENKMTLKNLITMAIDDGMETFCVSHYSYTGCRLEQTKDNILEFIKGYEDCVPITIYYGTAFGNHFPEIHYNRQTHCEIIYKLPNEILP